MQQNLSNQLVIIPRELVYADVQPHSTQEQSFIIKNKQANQHFELFFDNYDPQKYEMIPNRMQLKPYQDQLVVVKINVDQINSNFSLKDQILIKDANSNQSIPITITLLPASQLSHLSPHHSPNQFDEYELKEKYWQEYYDRKANESKLLSERVEDYKNIEEEIIKLNEEHQRQLDEKDEEIRAITNELHQSQQEAQLYRQQLEDLQIDFNNFRERKEAEIRQYENTLESDQNRYNTRLQAQEISNSPAFKLNEFNQQRIAKIESELSQLTLNYNLATGQLNEEKKQKKLLSDKLNQLKLENDRLLDEMQGLKEAETSNYSNLCSKYELAMRQLEHAEKQRKQLEEELQIKSGSKDAKLGGNNSDSEDLVQQIRVLKLKNEQLEKREMKIVEEKTRLELLYNDLLQEYNQTKTEFSVYKSHHKYPGEGQASSMGLSNNNNNRMNYNYTSTDSFNNNNNNNNSINDQQDGIINLYKQQTESLKKQIQDLEIAIQRFEEKEKENKKKMVILEKEKENLQQNAKYMTNLIDDLEFKAKEVEDRYRTDVIDLQQKNLELQGRVYALEKENHTQRDEIQNSEYLKEKIEIISKVNQKFELDIKQLKLKNQEEMQQMKQDLENYESLKLSFERRVEEYEHDNKILQKTNEDKDNIIKKLSDENEDLDHRCQLLMSENSKINELNRKYGIEIERVIAQLNASKEQTDWAEGKFKEILKEKEQLQKELNILEIQTKHTDVIDAQVIEELNDLREQMRRFSFEKERIYYQLKIEEENDLTSVSQKTDMIRFMKQIELKFKTIQNDTSIEISQLKNELANTKRELEIQIQQYADLKIIVDKKEQDYLKIAEEKRIQNNDLTKQREQSADIQRQVEQLNVQKQLEDKQKLDLIAQLQQEIQKQEEAVNVMREEMMNQNKVFKEVKNSQENAMQNMKQKFVGDLNEIYQKFNTYMNQAQSESSKKTGATNIRDDKKYIQRLFETYAENVNVVSHKEALIKKLQDKEKKMQEKEKTLLKEIERLNEINKKYSEDFQQMQKKGYTLSIGSKRQIVPGQKSGVNTFNVLNETNISKNPNKTNNQNNNYSQNDISVSFINQNDESTTKNTLKLKDIATLEAQLFTTKTNLEQSKEEVAFLKDYTKDLKEDLEKLQKKEEELLEENRSLQIKLSDQIKQNKSDKEKYQADIELVKTQYFTPENYQEKIQQLELKDKQIKELKDEINRKKDLVQSVKQLKEEQSYDMKTLQVEIERLQKELEKYKIRANKATQQMSGPTKEMKTQIESLKEVEKKLTKENEELLDQQKKLKAELTRANATVKDLRNKTEQQQLNSEQLNENNEQLEKTKEQLKKLKSEVDRKDTSIKSLKNKLESATAELEELKGNSKNFVTKNDFLSEQKKSDQAKVQLKKSEAQISMLVFLLKRIFRDNFVNLQKAKASSRPLTSSDFATQPTRSQQQPAAFNKFSESVNILGLSPEEIDQFLDPYQSSYKNVQSSQHNYNISHATEFYSDLMDRFEKELENIDENINVNSLYQMLYSVIEERVELVKSYKV
ncbi:hypothetical protein ABPG74_020159 [Tetrahymena malaccensis]